MRFDSSIRSMQAHTTWMQNSAHNVANLNTQNFDAKNTRIESDTRAVTQPSGQATRLAKEMADQIVLSDGFEAQGVTIRTQDAMLGTLLDMKG